MSENVEPHITLYDTAGQPGGPLGWNPFPMRVRYAVNFKGIPFKTVYLDYPNVEPTLIKLGASPTGNWPDGRPFYSLPVITDSLHPMEDGKPRVVSDSFAIVAYLDDYYPSSTPLLAPHTRVLQMFLQKHIDKDFYVGALAGLFIKQALSVISDAGQDYFRTTREKLFGKKLEDVCPKDSEAWKKSWDMVLSTLNDISTYMDQSALGKPFLGGDHPCFMDFVVVCFLNTTAMLLPEDYYNISNLNEGKWDRIVNNCATWKNF